MKLPLVALLVMGVCPGLLASEKPDALTPEQERSARVALHKVEQEVAIAKLLEGLNTGASRGLLVVRNVRVVDPAGEQVVPHQSVIVWENRILWVGGSASEPKLPDDTKVIDGGDHYLSPGLTDMHVHSSSTAGWLLDLANGVTGVRDMAGFPWMLKARDRINAGTMLAPSLTVAGPLINGFPLDGYAVLPADPLDARRMVREQAACGYNFVKVHNVIPGPIFDAVADQAAEEKMDLIGHVPHDITVRHAAAAGMRTMEHLKGFLDDRTLKLGETDYAAVSDGLEVWNTPTLSAARGYARGAEADAYLTSPEMRFVPRRKRTAWVDHLKQPEEPQEKAGRESAAIMSGIVEKLHGVHAKFLAGTDADNYPFQVMGFILIDELHRLEGAGFTPAEAIRAASSEAAKAMREPDEFGQLRKGMRADMVLLAANPLESTAAYRSNLGVMAHGVWLQRAALDSALDKLAAIDAEEDNAVAFTDARAQVALADAQALAERGFVLDARMFTALGKSLRLAGHPETADRFDRLADVPTTGPCAQRRP